MVLFIFTNNIGDSHVTEFEHQQEDVLFLQAAMMIASDRVSLMDLSKMTSSYFGGNVSFTSEVQLLCIDNAFLLKCR